MRIFRPAGAPLWLEAVLRSIERAMGDIWSSSLRLLGRETAELPDAAENKQGLIFDLTLGQPVFSDGSGWLTFSPSTHVHDAADVTFAPAGTVSATNVQAAIEELDSEKLSTVNNSNWLGADLEITNGGTGASSAPAARSNLGLGNVDNTSDANKPVSTAQQAALDLKLNAASYTAADVLAKILTVDGPGTGLDADLLDGQSGAYYLARANHTGTQLAASISDFSTAADARIAAAVGVSVQAFDAQLSAIAGLTPAADQMIYWTGATTAAMTSLTASGRTVMGASGVTGTGSVVFSANPTLTGTANVGAINASSRGDFGNVISVSGGSGFTAGARLHMYYSGGGLFDSYNSTTATYNPLTFSGSTLTFRIGAGLTQAVVVNSSAAVAFPAIGTTASAANAFLDSGASNNLLRSTSSSRYKTDVKEISAQQLSALARLRPISYRSKADADDGRRRHFGLIAEEVFDVAPMLVHLGYHEDQFEEYEAEPAVPGYVNENGDTIAPRPARKALRLKKGEQLRPDGVQYERLTVLLLAKVQEIDSRLGTVEKRNTGAPAASLA